MILDGFLGTTWIICICVHGCKKIFQSFSKEIKKPNNSYHRLHDGGMMIYEIMIILFCLTPALVLR
ncbi:DUF6868 family protein [Prochlorococcus sp. MIT 1313]|uniref:DUF6868 family protein n=1 Tax=Prochlorococcus TaxID=1218 RepID=UPI000AEB03FF